MGRMCMLPRQLVTPCSSFESTTRLTSRHTLPLSLLPLASCQVLLPGADGPATLPYALCLLLLSSRRFSLQCTMVVMYRCMQE